MKPILRKARLIRKPSIPRRFPTTGFEIIASSQLVEEENWEWYKPEEFYPVRIGEVFRSKYQVVGKLGYGGNGTTWLCRDLLKHKHVALKVATPDALERELKAMRHLTTIKKHESASYIRQMLDEFEIESKYGVFRGIVYPPLSISLRAFRTMLPTQALSATFIKGVLQYVLQGLDFLHTEAKVIHTDIKEDNILFGMNPKTTRLDLVRFELKERNFPCARKVDADRLIYISRPLVPGIYGYGLPVICDFGEARFGDYNNMIDIQPYQYRAPEVIFSIPWDEKVDIWSVGVMIWDLLGNGNLFRTTGGPNNDQDNIYHLASMIGMLGPPPKDFLERTKGDRLWTWFDENGHWRGTSEIPDENLESAEKQLNGEDKTQFLRFVRRMLKWKPEERSSAKELLEDPWLRRDKRM